MVAVAARRGRRGERVGARAGLGERVRREPLARGELRQILLLLRLAAVVDDGQRADAGVRAPRDAEGAELRRAFGDEQRGGLVELETAVRLGHLDREQADLAGAAQQVGHHAVLLLLDLAEARDHLAVDELLRGARHRPRLLAEVLEHEDVVGNGLDQERAAGRNGHGGHLRGSNLPRLTLPRVGHAAKAQASQRARRHGAVARDAAAPERALRRLTRALVCPRAPRPAPDLGEACVAQRPFEPKVVVRPLVERGLVTLVAPTSVLHVCGHVRGAAAAHRIEVAVEPEIAVRPVETVRVVGPERLEREVGERVEDEGCRPARARGAPRRARDGARARSARGSARRGRRPRARGPAAGAAPRDRARAAARARASRSAFARGAASSARRRSRAPAPPRPRCAPSAGPSRSRDPAPAPRRARRAAGAGGCETARAGCRDARPGRRPARTPHTDRGGRARGA